MLVTVATFDDAHEAHLVRGRLAAEGIAASVAFEGHVTLDWPMSQALGGVALQVSASDAEAAARLVADYRAGALALAADAAEDERAARARRVGEPDPAGPACTCCGSGNVRRRTPLGQKVLAVVLTLFGGAVFPTRDAWRCRACGHAWPTGA